MSKVTLVLDPSQAESIDTIILLGWSKAAEKYRESTENGSYKHDRGVGERAEHTRLYEVAERYRRLYIEVHSQI